MRERPLDWRRRWPLHARMFAGLVGGAAAGALTRALWPDHALLEGFTRWVAAPVGQLFLRLLFMLVVPLLFSALVLGVCGLGDLRRLGRLGAKTLLYTVVVSAIAVAIGLTLVNIVRPGEGLPGADRERLLTEVGARAGAIAVAREARSGMDLVVGIVPSNPVRAAADGDMLAVMFFSLVFGVGLALARGPSTRRLEETIEGVYHVSMRLIGLVIAAAPWGVAALLFVMARQAGLALLGPLARYAAVVVAGLTVHQLVVYPLSVRLLGGMSPVRFFRAVREPMITAFSTASSNATLPTSLRAAEENLHLPQHVSRFVLTLGSTANQNGTALFEGVTVLFLAQFYGVRLGVGEQALVVSLCILGGIGTAGVPAGSLPVVAMILGLVGVPPEGIGLVLGVDRLLDMCRTTLNVTGDLAAAVVVARGEPADPAPCSGAAIAR